MSLEDVRFSQKFFHFKMSVSLEGRSSRVSALRIKEFFSSSLSKLHRRCALLIKKSVTSSLISSRLICGPAGVVSFLKKFFLMYSVQALSFSILFFERSPLSSSICCSV